LDLLVRRARGFIFDNPGHAPAGATKVKAVGFTSLAGGFAVLPRKTAQNPEFSPPQ
jgi:hypothetical protein